MKRERDGAAGARGQAETPSGIPLEVTYRPGPNGEIPGEYPFTRGIHREMYRSRLWTFRQYAGFGDVRETNERFRYLLEQGQTGLSVAFDLPTQIGYDSDAPVAMGEVGKVGVPITSLEDMDALFDQIPLGEVSVSMTINATAAMLLAFLVGVANRRGVPLEALRGTVQNDLLKEFISRRTYRFPVKPSLRIATDIFDFCLRRLPRFNPISISGYHMREAGSTAVQEIALTLANAIAYLEAARERGLSLDALAPRVSFFFNAHNHLLEEVAKFRAARRLWAHIVRERFGLQDPECARLRFHAQTGGSTLAAQEPENNVVRVTVQALAAIWGGAQSLHTNSMDEAIGLPSKPAVRTALRTQQILAFESGAGDVADPLGGAPAVEALTDALEARAREVIEQIDRLGGGIAAVEAGYPQSLIEEEAYRHQRAVESGQRVIVGVNRFRDAGDESSRVAPQRVARDLEARRVDAVRRRKAARSSSAVDALRRELRAAVSGGANVVESLIPCAGGGVTIGEMTATLTEIFGEHLE